ncbi:MAG: DegV family protein [Lachnospiraceae bacterium]|nr:DegV family protein [Lachnospiraceae bacterium]
MGNIAIITDSNSGISQEWAKELGIYVIPMPFTIDGKEFLDGVTLFPENFYAYLEQDADMCTSQPSPESITKLWDELLQTHDEIVHIPMSSGLSGSCQTARMLAEDYDGRVQVVDNQRISVTQVCSVLDALHLAAAGRSAAQIREALEREGLEASIYIMVPTLKYLKKGGRVTPAGAALGTMLRLKPVLQIQGEKLDAFAKVRTVNAAKCTMLDALHKDRKERFADVRMQFAIAHTRNEAAAQEFKKEIEAEFPDQTNILVHELSLSVACHIGAGALACGCAKIMEV